MDSINPLNISKLLEMDYEHDFQPNDSPSDHDKLLKVWYQRYDFLDIHINQAGSPILAIEDNLQYELQISLPTFEEFEKSVAKNNLLTGHREADFEPTPNDRLGELDSSATEPSSHELFVPTIPDPKVPSRQAADLDYKKRAERQVEDGGSRIDKLTALRLETGRQFFLAKQKPHVVKDIDIRRWAVTANREIDLPGFVASSYWVSRSKRYHGICDRKITKFVTEKYLQEEPDRKKSAAECVALVGSRIQAYGLDCLWNADQSGFEYEMRPGRTLDLVGAKHVLALTRSESSMTHSCTVMICVSPGARKYLAVLFITLQEDKGVFEPIVKRTMFRASNLHVTASTSGKMTKELSSDDSWPTFADQEAVEELTPEELEYEMIAIPPKLTGQILPLDVLCFQMYKGYFRKVSN
ncbi:hypothetical protein RvY_05149 [Ramazzottius varieornatus]|uniref:Uncharacterized protein n=1 Tax=Ramazzottius varieornatus TaxID=947166 RepID=A0A1D1UU47_RAMVA|nr:hypothetical protein RvY_05149 [Ramazzottius varieornatus]